MKITFPHMGNMYIPIKTFFQSLGIDVITAPPSNQKTLELGVKHSPEFSCLPLKVNIGNLIQGLEKGADTIVMAGGIGPCRFGYYWELQREILSDLGYEFEMIVLDPPKANLYKLIRAIKQITGNNSLKKIWKAGKFAWKKAKILEQLEQLDGYARISNKINKAKAKRIYKSFEHKLDEAGTLNQVDTIEKEINEFYKDLRPDYDPLKVGLVGEIYTVLDSFVNLGIKRKLEDLGVYVHKSISLTEWANVNLLLRLLNINAEKNVEEAAKPYLNHFVGGHGIQSVGHTVIYADKKFDGVIHLLPFTCMPEIVAKSVLPEVSRKHNIPVMSLIIDEHSAEEGLNTRLEAFVDLIKKRKEALEV